MWSDGIVAIPAPGWYTFWKRTREREGGGRERGGMTHLVWVPGRVVHPLEVPDDLLTGGGKHRRLTGLHTQGVHDLVDVGDLCQ